MPHTECHVHNKALRPALQQNSATPNGTSSSYVTKLVVAPCYLSRITSLAHNKVNNVCDAITPHHSVLGEKGLVVEEMEVQVLHRKRRHANH